MDIIIEQWVRLQQDIKKEEAYNQQQQQLKELEIQKEVHKRLHKSKKATVTK